MATANDRDSEDSGFEILDELSTRVQNKFAQKQVVLKYVLVVPYQPQGVAVRWNLSRKVEADSVYVLYLDSFVPFNALF